MKLPATDLPTPDLEGYRAANVELASGAWPLRAAEELRSAYIFRALARAARVSQIRPPWPARFADAMHDELRHARLCMRIGARLRAPQPTFDVRPVWARLATLPEPRFRSAALVIAEVAIGETISTHLFRAGRSRAREPLTRWALTVIVADEVRHRQLGWEALPPVMESLSAAQYAALEREAAFALGAFEQQHAGAALSRLSRGEPFDEELAELGVLAPERRVETFYAAVEELVLPKLRTLGLDAQRVWACRHRPDAL